MVSYLTLTGNNALGAAAFEEAWRSFQSALAHRGEVDPRQRAELLACLAMAERGLNQWGTAEANLLLWPSTRLTQTIAATAAAAGSQWEAAEEHFQIAMQQVVSLPNRLEQADVHRFHAMMLLDRAAPGDRERAQTLLSEVLEDYERIGMPRHIEMTQILLD